MSDQFDKNRRKFLQYFLAGSAVFVLENSKIGGLTNMFQPKAVAAKSRIERYQAIYEQGKGFPQSVASGDPSPTGAIIWTRVDPSILTGMDGTTVDAEMIYWLDNPKSNSESMMIDLIDQGKFIMFDISKTDDFSQTVLTGFAPIWNDFDNTVKIETDGYLDSRTTYFYRFTTKTGHVSQTGKFKTLPANGDLNAVKFAYVSCQDYTNGYFNAYAHLADESLDFVVHLGDYIYESVGDPTYQSPISGRKIKLPSGNSKAFTVEDYRTLYRIYKNDPDLQKFHENHAMVSTWDDHEFANDTYYPAIAPDDSLDPNQTRRLIANQVWFEYTPARLTFDSSLGFENSITVYRSFKVGNLADIMMTDQRLYRSAHPCGETTLDRYLADYCTEIDSSNRTMLGNEQKNWFLNQLTNSTAIWIIWGNEVQFGKLTLSGRYITLDAWDGYGFERTEIAKQIHQLGVNNLITITGDFHTFEATLMKTDYEDPSDANAVAVEFLVGSITSSNLRESVRNALNNTGDLSAPIAMPAVEKIIEEIRSTLATGTTVTSEVILGELQKSIKAENPWVKLFNSTTHGYAILELSTTKATWTAYEVDQIETRGAKKALLWQCEVPKDKVDIQILKGDQLLNV